MVILDAIWRAREDVAKNGMCVPDEVALNPVDVLRLEDEVSKRLRVQPIISYSQWRGVKTVHGLRIVEDPTLPDGTIIVRKSA